MRPSHLLALALLTSSQALLAQVYTTPAGYETRTLVQGLNAVGLSLHNAPVAAGDFDVVNGTSLTDTDVTFAPIAGRTYILEITSGVPTVAENRLIGTIQAIPAANISGSVITTPDNLESVGLAVGDTYNLRLAPTLEDIFTTIPQASGGVLAGGGLNYTNADIVWIPTGPGSFEKYFLKTGAGAGFQRITGTQATNFEAAPNIPVIYADGIIVQKKGASPVDLTLSGLVKMSGTNSVLLQGINVIGHVAAAGLTLKTAGLEDDLGASLTVANADIVWIQNPSTLEFTKYMRHTGPGGNWRYATGTNGVPLTTEEDPPISGAFLIQRKSPGSAQLDLNVPY